MWPTVTGRGSGQQIGANSLANWSAAERLQHQVIEEGGVFLSWLKRGRPFGDPWATGFDAQKESCQRSASSLPPGPLFEDERSEHDDIEKGAHFCGSYLVQIFGDPWADWLASEVEVVSGGLEAGSGTD